MKYSLKCSLQRVHCYVLSIATCFRVIFDFLLLEELLSDKLTKDTSMDIDPILNYHLLMINTITNKIVIHIFLIVY